MARANVRGAVSRPSRVGAADVAARLQRARRAQKTWASVPVAERLGIIRSVRHRLAEAPLELAVTIQAPTWRPPAESLSAEVLPLAEACRFLERRAKALLAPRRLGTRGRPAWLFRAETEIRREPLGVVLVVGASNYPLLLPGVQMLQALTAGNAVIVKPGRNGATAAAALAGLLISAGLDPDLVTVMEESVDSAIASVQAGVDKVLLTGSRKTGQALLAQLAANLTPATLELSGCDAVYVREDADLDLVASALRFGLMLNGGATCIAPRRVFAPHAVMPTLEAQLKEKLAEVPPVVLESDVAERLAALVTDATEAGARLAFGNRPRGRTTGPIVLADTTPEMAVMGADIFAPILCLTGVDGDDDALELDDRCSYALGATVFGQEAGARSLARRVRAGVVVINDMIVPTADPRVPFGGRDQSGFGVTRGAEGLLELTQIKAVLLRRGKWRPHLDPLRGGEENLFAAFIRAAHAGSWATRMRAIVMLAKSAKRSQPAARLPRG